MRVRRVVLVVILALALLTIAAQPPPEDGLLSLEDALAATQKPSVITLAVGVIAALAAEYSDAFKNLPKKWKRPAFLGISLIVPLAGSIAGILLLKWMVTIDLFWYALQAGLVSFGSGTLMHGFLPTEN